MSRAGRTLPAMAAAAAVVAVAAAAVLAMADSGPTRPPSGGVGASVAVDRFFERYVASDGRVVRHDEGGDTVSEGQAYAMLMAVASGDRARFDRVWGWTRENLQREDGLLSYLWRDGRVADPEAAADADLDAAHALILAGRRFGDRSLRRDGLEIASAILSKETVRRHGRRVLVAGPWARSGTPWINPSYFSPRAFAVLGRASGHRGWAELRGSSFALTRELTANGPGLAPDWARLGPPGRSRPSSSPGGRSRSARFGYDAVRVPLRSAWACSARERNLAARPWDFLHGQAGGGIGPEYGLGGKRLAQGTHPAAMVAGAAAARAAGERGAAGRLLDRAADEEYRSSTYYGAALVALGRLMLETRSLNAGCGSR